MSHRQGCPPVTFATMLREGRKAAGFTQEGLADALGVGQSAVSAWEIGRAVPTPGALYVLARLLRLDLDELVAQHTAELLAIELDELEQRIEAHRPAPAADPSSATGPPAGDDATTGGAPPSSSRPGVLRGEGSTTATGRSRTTTSAAGAPAAVMR